MTRYAIRLGRAIVQTYGARGAINLARLELAHRRELGWTSLRAYTPNH